MSRIYCLNHFLTPDCHVYGVGVMTNTRGLDLLDVSITITMNYNSPHMELLLNDVCLANPSLVFYCSLRLIALSESESESYVTTDGHPASLSWNKAPIWGLRPDLYYCLTVASLLIWGALSDERTDFSFTIAAGPRQRSHFGVNSVGLVTIFYCLRFETTLFVASYDSQGHGGGIRPRLHIGYCSV
jgi:hypothetical protein